MQFSIKIEGNHSEWYIVMHDKGHFLHINNGPDMYGMDYTYQAFDKTGISWEFEQQYFSIQVTLRNVTYIEDKNNLCNVDRKVRSGVIFTCGVGFRSMTATFVLIFC